MVVAKNGLADNNIDRKLVKKVKNQKREIQAYLEEKMMPMSDEEEVKMNHLEGALLHLESRHPGGD